ncbi:hypothetical protein [Chamaesiphon polymorphus]|uniref:hypothetical protein n=1 Tax=Chamaesiphon polymorphus TaxID=2107691 RepID=UPI0015E70A6A|nr:hypothetical protein [Chamaesiphon polymorphus]
MPARASASKYLLADLSAPVSESQRGTQIERNFLASSIDREQLSMKSVRDLDPKVV